MLVINELYQSTVSKIRLTPIPFFNANTLEPLSHIKYEESKLKVVSFGFAGFGVLTVAETVTLFRSVIVTVYVLAEIKISETTLVFPILVVFLAQE